MMLEDTKGGLSCEALEEMCCLPCFFQTGRTTEKQTVQKHVTDLIISRLSADIAYIMLCTREKGRDICRDPHLQ